jgi:DNA-binding XRE family transcriptional regulator
MAKKKSRGARRKIAISDLTTGERLFLWRHRGSVGQRKAAEKYGVTERVYGKWERDEKTRTAPPRMPFKNRLNRIETAILVRRREGVTQAAAAQAIGVSLCWYKKMEKGLVDNTRLLNHWNV